MRTGRPIEREEAKRAPLSLRTSPALRDRVEKAAEHSTRSLAQEVEHRLEMTFHADDLFGGAHNNAFFRMILGAVAQIEARNGATWTEDHETYCAVRSAIERLLLWNRPRPAWEPLEAAQSALTVAEREVAEAKAKLVELQIKMGRIEFVASDDPVANLILQPLDGLTGIKPPTPEQLAQEAELSKILGTKLEAQIVAINALRSALDPLAESARSGKRIGTEAAEDQFRILGPKLKG